MPSPSEMARELLTLVLWPLRLFARCTLGRELNMNAVAGRGKHVKHAEDSGGMRVIADYKGSWSSSKNGKRSYGSQAAPGDLPSEISDKVRTHPCYSEEAHHPYARIQNSSGTVVAKIGGYPRDILINAGIEPIDQSEHDRREIGDRMVQGLSP